MFQAPDFEMDLTPDPTRIRISRHGLTPEMFSQLLQRQGGRCAICRSQDPGGSSWCVDHDHKHCPGQYGCASCVRGLLCNPCNTMLAQAKDNPHTLEVGAMYLKASKQW